MFPDAGNAKENETDVVLIEDASQIQFSDAHFFNEG